MTIHNPLADNSPDHVDQNLALRARSGDRQALHGWPGSVIEFMKIIGPLTDPTAHGGRPEDAFHVVAPSLPGHGFSDKPTATGWDVPRIANAWIVLMRRLGYTRWVAQGGDWGSLVATAIGVMKPDDCAAIHVNMPLVFPEPDQLQDMDAFDRPPWRRWPIGRKRAPAI